MSKLLRFKGISINKDDFEKKYDISLSDIEWSILISRTEKSWEENIDEFRLYVFRHIKAALDEIGYKPVLDKTEIKFKKKG